MDEPRPRSLVVLPNWVGDTVMTLPVLAALGESGRTVTALAKPHLERLVAAQPGVTDLLTRQPSVAATIARIRQQGFDEAIILPNSFRSVWLAYRAAIPHRWGYAAATPEGLMRRLLLRPSVGASRKRRQHQVEDYAALLTAMRIPLPQSWLPRLSLSTEQRAAGPTLLARSRIDPDHRPLIGLFPGAEFGPSKRWPWRRFAEVARRLRRQRPGCQQIIFAGPKEVWMAVRVHEESGKIHPVVGPDLDLAQLASVLVRLDLLITNDSGPMHMAAALETPCLALFGPTDPRRTSPVGDRHRVLYTERWCSPCFRRHCPLLHHNCMRDLTVDTVVRRALDMLPG